jgi:hypothetical protein
VADGQAVVGIGVDPDAGFNVVAAVFLLGDLQGSPVLSDGVVAGDEALFLYAEDVGEIAEEGREGAPGLFGGDAKALSESPLIPFGLKTLEVGLHSRLGAAWRLRAGAGFRAGDFFVADRFAGVFTAPGCLAVLRASPFTGEAGAPSVGIFTPGSVR